MYNMKIFLSRDVENMLEFFSACSYIYICIYIYLVGNPIPETFFQYSPSNMVVGRRFRGYVSIKEGCPSQSLLKKHDSWWEEPILNMQQQKHTNQNT